MSWCTCGPVNSLLSSGVHPTHNVCMWIVRLIRVATYLHAYKRHLICDCLRKTTQMVLQEISFPSV